MPANDKPHKRQPSSQSPESPELTHLTSHSREDSKSISKRKPEGKLISSGNSDTLQIEQELQDLDDQGSIPLTVKREHIKRKNLDESSDPLIMFLRSSWGPRTILRKVMIVSISVGIFVFLYLALATLFVPKFATHITSNVEYTLSSTAKSARILAKNPSTLPVFSLILTVIGGIFGGAFAEQMGQAPMLGMLLAGVALRNIFPFWIVPVPHEWTSRLWTLALASVVARAGLSLDASKLIHHFGITLTVGCIPVLIEAVSLGFLASWVLKIPLCWTMTMAFGVASVSPGVVVPLVLNLREKPQWKTSRVLPMMLSSIGIDVLVATSGFGVSLATCFSGTVNGHAHDHHSWFVRAIEEIGLGILGGGILGLFAIFLHRVKVSETMATGSLFLCSSLAMISAKSRGFAGAASCATILTWAAVANVWNKEVIEESDAKLKFAWTMFKPFLFPVIGASISFSEIDMRVFILCLILVIISASIKMSATYSSITSMNLTKQEAYFWGGVWTGKASVQATLCHVALEQVLRRGYGGRPEEKYAQVVFTGMVCAILVGIVFASTWAKQFEERGLNAHGVEYTIVRNTKDESPLIDSFDKKGVDMTKSFAPSVLRNVKVDQAPGL